MSLDTMAMAMALTGPVERVLLATEKDRKTRRILWMIIVYPSCSKMPLPAKRWRQPQGD
jgi:hypothetical protein